MAVSAGALPRVGAGGLTRRGFQSRTTTSQLDNTSAMYYAGSVAVLVCGLSYAAVPLYQAFCQATGFGGATKVVASLAKVATMVPVEERLITIKFNADTGGTMRWKFQPQQRQVQVVPGETALAFYTATNPTDEAIIGMSTYNVVPLEAGQYFNKIQCFCFEEQWLDPHEQVDMPVFFFIDPEFAEDPLMQEVDEITLSYTFFRARQDSTRVALNGAPRVAPIQVTA